MISFVQAVHALRTCNHSTSPLRPLPPPWPQKTTKQDRKCPRSLHPQNPTSMFPGASSPPASQLGCGLHGHRPKRSHRLAPPPRLLASPSACGRWPSGSPSSLPGWCPRGTRFLALGSGTLSLPWVKSLSDADHPAGAEGDSSGVRERSPPRDPVEVGEGGGGTREGFLEAAAVSGHVRPAGVGGVLPVPLAQGELQAAGHHAQVPLQVSGTHGLQGLQPVPR